MGARPRAANPRKGGEDESARRAWGRTVFPCGYKYNVQLLYAKTVFREAVKVRKKLKGRSAAVKVRFSYVRYNSIGPLRGP
jgi:hypothetical protein